MDDQNKGMNEQWAPATGARERGYADDPGYVSSEYASGADYETPRHVDSEGTERRTSEVREEIDRTREDMSETIDAIQDRLRPRNVASRAAESVREATVGRVKEFASTMTGRNSSDDDNWNDDPRYRSSGWDGSPRNGFVDRIRDNPLASAIAAGSIAWLLFGGRRHRSGYASSWQDRDRAMYGSTRGGQPFVREARIDLDSGPSFEGERDNPGQGWRQRGNRDWRARDRSDSGQADVDVIARAREAASDVSQRARAAASDMRRRGGRFAAESPLMTGVFAAALGLAIGLAIPETERENEIMGEAKDSIVDRGKDAVRTAAERVQSAAGEVQRVAGDALKGVTSGSAAQQSGTSAGQSPVQQAQGSPNNQNQHPELAGTPTAARARTPDAGSAPGAATEPAVPGMQAGSGGTGSTPTTKTNRGAKNR